MKVIKDKLKMKVIKDKQLCNQPSTSRGKKTNAEKCKAYRERKKLNNQLPISMEKKKTAERVKACRQRKKLEKNKQDILSSPGDIDPITFLQVEMDPHQDVGVDSDVVLSPASPNPEQLQEVPVGDEATEQQTTSAGNNVDDRRHKCDICHYKFKRLDHLKRHMKIHPIDEVLVAQVRQQCAREEAAARKKAALEDELRRYTCNVCHYKFKRADHLKRHMTRSHPEELALIAATEELAKARQAARAAKLMGRFEDSEENPDDESAAEDLKEMHPNDERRFACTLCDFKFKRRDHLNRHMTVHTDQIILPKAESSSDIVGDRTEEENLWLSSMRRFSCTVCEAKFKRADHLKRHMIKHSSKPSSSFPSFPRNLGIRRNYYLQKDMKVYDESNYKVSKKEIEIHYGESSTTPDLMELDNSSELVAADEGSNSNVGNDDADPSTKIADKTDDEERRFICNVCNFRFKRRFHLMRHMIKHTEDKFVNLGLAREGENEKKSEEVVPDNESQSDTSPGLTRALGQVIFKCNVCDLQFKQPYRLKIHMARHSEERLFACPLCNYRAKLACNLRKHMLTHSDEKPFACHLCNYKGKLACALKDHIMLIHSDDKPYACDVCEFKAKVPSHLKKHMVSHQVEAPYQCTVCDFRAKRAGNLKEHMGTHTNEKRFRCKMCSYGTRRQRNLRKHMAVHFDDKPYLCEICPYRAKLPNYLKDHMKTHTDMKPYDCPLCDYKSRQSRQLKRHIQSHAESFGVNSMVLSEMTN